MKRLALIIAAMGFLVLAIVGWFSGVSPATCALRAGIGAVLLYVALVIGANILVHILADIATRAKKEH